MRVAGIVVGILMVLAAITFGRRISARTWRDPAYAEMMARTILARPFSSYAGTRGVVRGTVPMWAGIGFIGVGALAAAALPAGPAHRASPILMIAGAGFALGIIGIALNLWIVWFNRPRLLVPPFMRAEEGMVTAWWRSRDLPPEQRRAAHMERRTGPPLEPPPARAGRPG